MAFETPNTDPILDPRYGAAEAKRHFSTQLAVARDMADYGAQLLKRVFATCGRDKIEDLVVIAALFRQALVSFDACVLCLENGAVDASNVHARGLLETDLYLEWILTQGKERWGRQLYVANLRQERDWDRRVIPGTAENAIFASAWRDTIGKPFVVDPVIEAGARKQEAAINAILEKPAYHAINTSFDKARGTRPYEPEWYKPGPDAPRSIAHIADMLGRKAHYATLYSVFSGHVHGTRTKNGFCVDEDGMVVIEPVRSVADISSTFSPTVAIWRGLCRRIIHHYRPDEAQAFALKYENDWKSRLSFPEIKEATVPVVI